MFLTHRNFATFKYYQKLRSDNRPWVYIYIRCGFSCHLYIIYHTALVFAARFDSTGSEDLCV